MKIIKRRSYYWIGKELECLFCDFKFILEKSDIKVVNEAVINNGFYGIKLNCPDCGNTLEFKKSEFEKVVKKSENCYCSADCNNCTLLKDSNREQVYRMLKEIVFKFPQVANMINKYCTNMGNCPECGAYNFNHRDHCSIFKEKL